MSAEREETWEPIGEPAPAALEAARIELHWAAQAPAAAAYTLIAPLPDDSHTSLEWDRARRSLVGRATPSGRRAALRVADLTLAVLDATDAAVAERPLAGQTLEDALAWLAQALGAPAGTVLRPAAYELPARRDARQKFDGGARAAFAELARWYATADAMLRAVAASTPGASPVRCWPHHFDIATLLPGPVAGGAAGERTLGVGFAPGDRTYGEPYWYVTPWPYPRLPDQLPALPAGGGWHHHGWFGAVFTATAALRPATPAERASGVSAFIAAASRGVASLMGPEGSPAGAT